MKKAIKIVNFFLPVVIYMQPSCLSLLEGIQSRRCPCYKLKYCPYYYRKPFNRLSFNRKRG